jgi:transcriptional regulator with XRE-family HTH domain
MNKTIVKKISLGQRIRRLRREREWTQEEFAEKVGIHWRSAGRYEKDMVLPAADVLKTMADVFGVSIDYLVLGDTDNASLRVQNKDLFKRFQQLDRVSPEKIKGLIEVMDVYIRENAAKELLTAE